MSSKLLALAAGLLMGAAVTASAEVISPSLSLTPVPYQMKVGSGSFELPVQYTVSTAGLPAEMAAEADKFVKAVNAASGYHGSVTGAAEATIAVALSEAQPEEGYKLQVTATGVTVEASTPAGLFFAFQTLKKLLPPNVMAGVNDPAVTEYALPIVNITDKPRFPYRGLEIDCARHYHSMNELKRMLDVMSYYKMNRFHWHITDDQGWRCEIEKYPKLTQIGSIAPNAYWYDFKNKYEYWTNEQYGPLYYTKADMKEIVQYAKNLHIEVFPEIDMPGHMVAAINAYPEFSCNPEGDHAIWYVPGVSRDVLNVANPAVVQFCKDVLTELADIFPYEYIHIGGDETPTSAWEGNAECQALMAAEGMTSPHQLQSRFAKQMADHLQTLGKKTICWNEVITASGADTKLAQDADMLIYGWLPGGADKAVSLGLRTVWCHTSYYYLDYGQSSQPGEPRYMGGVINLQSVYNVEPVPSGVSADKLPLYYGVNGNLWCEYIAEDPHVEYMALPRMIAIAETGWTPASKKNFDSFCKRFTNDAVILDYNDYQYGRHYLTTGSTDPGDKVMPTPGEWYRLVTRADHDANRRDRVIEVVADGSPLIGSLGASVGRLWTNVSDKDNDYQLWQFVADPDGSGKYALINKGVGSGSANPNMSGSSVSAQWRYDNVNVNYNFLLGEGSYYGEIDGAYYYSIRSDKGSSMYMNCAQAGQKLAVNNWGDPADGNGGLWLCAPENGVQRETTIWPEITDIKAGDCIVLTNAVDRFNGVTVADNGANYLGYSSDPFADVFWTVESLTANDDNSLDLTLVNLATGRAIGAPEATAQNTMSSGFFSGNLGYPVQMADKPVTVNIHRNADDNIDCTVSIGGKNIFPIPMTAEKLAGTISSGSTIAGQNPGQAVGGVWHVFTANPVEFTITDEQGTVIFHGYRSIPDGTEDNLFPVIPDYEYVSGSIDEKAGQATAVYRRSHFNITFDVRDNSGVVIDIPSVKAEAGQTVTLAYPTVDHYTYVSGDVEPGTAILMDRDTVIAAVYTTQAIHGVKAVGNPVTELVSGNAYLIRDAHADRNGYRYVNLGTGKITGSTKAENVSSVYTWMVEADGRDFYVKNLANGLYVPQLVSGSCPAMVSKDKADKFRFTYRKSSANWTIRGTNSLYWNGNSDLTLAGWSEAHPYEIYEFISAPCYMLEFNCVDIDKTEDAVLSTSSTVVPAGNSYIWAAPEHKGYTLVKVEGYDSSFNAIDGHKHVVAYYRDSNAVDLLTPDNDRPADGAVYDLQGRRLKGASTPGLYIINGQKILVR